MKDSIIFKKLLDSLYTLGMSHFWVFMTHRDLKLLLVN